MHVTQPETHDLLRESLERVVMFTTSQESDADAKRLYSEISSNYFQPNPLMRLWVGTDDDNKVVAHLLATVDDYFGGKFVTIHQCWKDMEIKDFTLDEKKQLVEIVKEFGRPFGCTDVRTFAMNEEVAKILETYGFERTERVMLKVPIEEVHEEN
jgi:hypothetical protein